MNVVTQLQQFRQAIYKNLCSSQDATFELMDAVLLTRTAQSLADLSLSCVFRRQWSSVYEAVQDTRPDREQLMSSGGACRPLKLIALIILIALAMTSAWLQGKRTKLERQEKYVCRIKETGRTRRRHSNFWSGLYGFNWLIAVDSCQEWVESMLSLVRNKKSFYQKG